MLIAWPVNLNVSCKLHPYSLQRTRSPPGSCLPKRIRNTYPRNYYDLKGKDIDVYFYFYFLRRGIILWIELPWPENSIHNIIPLLRKKERKIDTLFAVIYRINLLYNWLFRIYHPNLELLFCSLFLLKNRCSLWHCFVMLFEGIQFFS